MTIRKLPSGKWQVDIQPGGRGKKRFRKTFESKVDAVFWMNKTWNENAPLEHWQQTTNKKQSYKELVVWWYEKYGKHLEDGTKRLSKLQAASEHLPEMIKDWNKETIATYQAIRSTQVKNATVNREVAYITAVINKALELEKIKVRPIPAKITKLKETPAEMIALNSQQLQQLFSAIEQSKNPDLETVTKICISTGARWDEAESLQSIGKEHLSFVGKGRKRRSVPISADFEGWLRNRPGPPYTSCYSAFREAVERAELALPEGQLTHVLRHTFASHFLKNGGDLTTLSKILGHTSITTTNKYAHLVSGSTLQLAAKLNPLSFVNKVSTK